MMRAAFCISCCCLFLGCQPGPDIPKKVGIVRLGKVDETFCEAAKREIGSFYNVQVLDLGKRDLPTHAYYPPRQRYRADRLIRWLRETRPDSVDYLLALTGSDVSHTRGEIADYGIMGLAYQPGRSGVVSTFRVGKGAKNRAHVLERFSKIVLHELGHNFGLGHCAHAKHCLMRDACGSVKTTDEEEKAVCEVCRRQLGNLLRQG